LKKALIGASSFFLLNLFKKCVIKSYRNKVPHCFCTPHKRKCLTIIAII
jgi:hypothetical protein